MLVKGAKGTAGSEEQYIFFLIFISEQICAEVTL